MTRETRRQSCTCPIKYYEKQKQRIIMPIIVKSLINGVVSWLLVALIVTLKKDVSFVQVLTEPYTIFLAVAAAFGSYAGYNRKMKK